jgi:hypothetical protein
MYDYQGFDAVEVWNGPWESDQPWNADNAAALAEWSRSLAAAIHAGRWRPAMGNSDTHLANQVGIPQTVVLADELSTTAILAGIQAGRSWIAESSAIDLSLTVWADGRTAGIGDHLTTHDKPVVVRADVRGVPSGTMSLHTYRGTVHRDRLLDDGSGTIEWTTTARESAYVRLEVRRPDAAMAARTNPVILG